MKSLLRLSQVVVKIGSSSCQDWVKQLFRLGEVDVKIGLSS